MNTSATLRSSLAVPDRCQVVLSTIGAPGVMVSSGGDTCHAGVNTAWASVGVPLERVAAAWAMNAGRPGSSSIRQKPADCPVSLKTAPFLACATTGALAVAAPRTGAPDAETVTSPVAA